MPKEYRTIQEVAGPLMMVRGVEDVAFDELGEIELVSGETRRCKVLEIDGDKVIKELAPGEVLKVDTGNVVAFERTVSYEIETVKGIKNIFLGGEGLFLTRLVGPGKVILQTQNFNDFAGRIAGMIPSK